MLERDRLSEILWKRDKIILHFDGTVVHWDRNKLAGGITLAVDNIFCMYDGGRIKLYPKFLYRASFAHVMVYDALKMSAEDFSYPKELGNEGADKARKYIKRFPEYYDLLLKIIPERLKQKGQLYITEDEKERLKAYINNSAENEKIGSVDFDFEVVDDRDEVGRAYPDLNFVMRGPEGIRLEGRTVEELLIRFHDFVEGSVK